MSAAATTSGCTSTRRTAAGDSRPPGTRARCARIAQADSVALDPHKWLFVPVEAGLVLVRDAAAMRDGVQPGAALHPAVDGSAGGVGGLPWFSEYGFQQTRGFRALKVWMTMQQYGLTGFKAAIDENIELAAYLAERVRGAAELA